ncbi:ankyrin repeat-containing domain protein [Melanogaster broomeanus]|nr:ankyrin repeat-containing domain protein [Melanogaster broomeanus]
MDPITVLSTTATAIQLFQLAVDVSSALRQYIAAVRGAESSCSGLIDQITLISKAARAAQSVLENSPPPSFRTPELQALHTEWFRSDRSPARCKTELEGLLGWLLSQNGASKFKRGLKRLIWPLDEKKIRTAIQTFEGHMPYFRDMLSIETASWVQAMYSEIKNEHEHTRSNETADARRKLLKWLDGLDCTVKHEITHKLRQKTTGEWLLNEELYMDWHNSSIRFLWLGGKRGSTIIDNLSSGLANNETLAYFYCDFRTPRSTSTMEILRSLAVQFLRNSKVDWLSSKPFSELVTRKEQGAGPPVDIDTNSDLLRHAARLHQKPMIVVDALDECDDLSQLLDELVKLYADGHCRVFVTARPLYHINRSFASLPSISLGGRVDAVRKDMYFHINTELESRDKLKTLSHDLQEEIRVALMEKANGMFRLVQLQLDRLNGCWSLGDLREALETLPATLYETYDRMLGTIDKKEFGGRVARRALMWLVTALRPLTLSQLTEALAINVEKLALDPTFAPMHETGILEICGSFVSYDEKIDIITLSHYSVKEYLTSKDVADKTYFVDHPRASFELASVSIYSIMFFIDRHGDAPRDLLAHVLMNHFPRYAMTFGFRHLKNCVPEYNDRLLGVLVTLQDHVSKHHRSHATLLCDTMDEPWMTKISQLALYIIIRFGHVSLLRHYLDHHSIQVTKGANPLVYAALYADVPRCQMLLDSGLDVNAEAIVPKRMMPVCDQSMLPLTAATFSNQELLMLLVRRTTVPRDAILSVLQVDPVDDVPRTGDLPEPSAIDFLLQHGADPMLSVAEGNTCLHLLLARWSHRQSSNLLEIGCLLVEAGGDPAALNDWGLSPFHLALRQGASQVVQWLIAKGFRPPLDAILHATHSPSKNLHNMLHVLFEYGVASDIEDDHGDNALHMLSLYCRESVNTQAVKLLLDKGCDMDHLNHQGNTPLQRAAWRHSFPYVEWLIDQGAQLPHDIINLVCSPLNHRFGHRRLALLVRLVKKHGASCQARTDRGDNALHILLGEQYSEFFPEPMEEFLLLMENGCDIHATNSSGTTVLGIAIKKGHTSIARSLISRVAHEQPAHMLSDSGDAEGNTILHHLCNRFVAWQEDGVKTWVEKVELLHEAGLARHVNKPNNQGFTPLCIILQRGEDGTVTVPHLLRLGAKFSDVNPFFLDNVQWASKLPWYCDATEAYDRALAKPTITFSDVVRVHHLLTDKCCSKLPVCIVGLIMDMAEYWACTKVRRENVQCTTMDLDGSHEPIALPVVDNETRCWMPRRVTFSWKQTASNDLDSWRYPSDKLVVEHQKVVYALPWDLNVWNLGIHLQNSWMGNSSWQSKISQPGDMLSAWINSYGGDSVMKLEFLQIDVYFTMRPTDDPPSCIGGKA